MAESGEFGNTDLHIFGNEVEDRKANDGKEIGELKARKQLKYAQARERYVEFIQRIINNNIEDELLKYRQQSYNEQHGIEDCNSPENKRPEMNSERTEKGNWTGSNWTTANEEDDLIYRVNENFDEINSCDDANISCETVWGSPSSHTQSYWFEDEVVIVPPNTKS